MSTLTGTHRDLTELQAELRAELRTQCEGKQVAYVCADPGIGIYGTKGASVHVQAVVRVLRAAGAQVTIFAAKTGGEPPADLADVPVHLLGAPAKTSDPADRERQLIQTAAGIENLVAAHGRFDVYYERYSLFSSAGARWAAAQGMKVIAEINAPLIEEHSAQRGLQHTGAARSAITDLLTAADVAVCVSEPVRQWALSQAPESNAVAIPNGADIHRFGARTLQRTTGVPTIGFVGTLKPWHGVDVLVRAAAPLIDSGAANLLIVGDGPLGAHIDSQAQELGITITRTGAVDPAQMPAYLAAMDIGVAPYPADADTYFSPLKVLEYMAAGLAVVASDVGQLPQLIDQGRTGILVPASDSEALREGLAALVTNPTRRSELGAAARAQAVRMHSWENTVARTLRALPQSQTVAGHTAGAGADRQPAA